MRRDDRTTLDRSSSLLSRSWSSGLPVARPWCGRGAQDAHPDGEQGPDQSGASCLRTSPARLVLPHERAGLCQVPVSRWFPCIIPREAHREVRANQRHSSPRGRRPGKNGNVTRRISATPCPWPFGSRRPGREPQQNPSIFRGRKADMLCLGWATRLWHEVCLLVRLIFPVRDATPIRPWRCGPRKGLGDPHGATRWFDDAADDDGCPPRTVTTC